MAIQCFMFYLFNNLSLLPRIEKKNANSHTTMTMYQHCLKLFIFINLFDTHKTLWGTHFYDSHLMDKKIEAEKR